MFPSSGEETETPTQLGTLERADLNHWTQLSRCSPPTWGRKQVQFPKRVFQYLEFQMMDKSRNPAILSAVYLRQNPRVYL
jgi:hypothetical protein